MRKFIPIILSVLFILPFGSSADEGMWLPMFIKRLNIDDMQSKGLQLTAEKKMLESILISFYI